MTKIELLEAIFEKLTDIHTLMEQDEFSDEEIDEMYSNIGDMIETVDDMLTKEEELP